MKKYPEIYLKTWKNHGNIMEFCQSEKVGTLGSIHTCDLLGMNYCMNFSVPTIALLNFSVYAKVDQIASVNAPA